MNATINKFLLAGDKLMPEHHLEKPGLTYSTCEQFIKDKKKNRKIQRNRRLEMYIL